MILSVCLTCAALDLCAAEERGNPSRYGMLLKSQVTVWVQRKYSATTFDPIIGKMLRPASVHPERKAGAGMELLRSIDGDFFINPPPVRNNRLESPGHPNWTTSFGFFAQRGWARRSALFGAAKTSFRTFAQGEPGDRASFDFGGTFGTAFFLGRAVFTPELLTFGVRDIDSPEINDGEYHARRAGRAGKWTIVPTLSIRATF